MILAELLAATLNSVAFIWRTSPASTELEAHTLDWTAQLLGLPSGWHGHIEDTASISTIAALAAARESNGGSVVVCSEEAHSSVERAARLLGLETRKITLDDEFRLDAGALISPMHVRSSPPWARRLRLRSIPVGPRRCVRGRGCLAPRRRGLCGLGVGLSRAPLVTAGVERWIRSS
jgi:hypothetical protein